MTPTAMRPEAPEAWAPLKVTELTGDKEGAARAWQLTVCTRAPGVTLQ